MQVMSKGFDILSTVSSSTHHLMSEMHQLIKHLGQQEGSKS